MTVKENLTDVQLRYVILLLIDALFSSTGYVILGSACVVWITLKSGFWFLYMDDVLSRLIRTYYKTSMQAQGKFLIKFLKGVDLISLIS